MTPPAPGRRWYRPGGADLLTLVVVLGVSQTAGEGLLGDPGLGWHLRTVDSVREHGWPTADPFSGPSHGNYWLANQWLGDVGFWAGWKLAGLNGIVAFTLFMLALPYRLLYGFLRSDGVPWPVALGWSFLAVLGSYYIWAARPNVVTFLAVTVLARTFTLFHEGRIGPGRLLWLPPLFAVWANCHGGFVAGLMMGGVAVSVELLLAAFHPDADARTAAGRRAGVLVAVGLASVAATLANPYGWRVYPWVASLLGDDYFMNLNVEWLSPDFHADGSGRVELLLILFPAVFAVSRHRPNLTLLALALVWMHLALTGRRYVPLWVMTTVPLLARAALELDPVNRWYASRPDIAEMFRPRAGGWLGVVVLALGLAGWAAFAPQITMRPSYFPTTGLHELLRRRQPDEVVVHGPNFGGYLTWHGWPGFRVWIDDRNEVHGKDAYEAYFELERTRPGWEAKLAATGARWVAVPPGCPLADRLGERPGEWERVYADGLVDLFRRVTGSPGRRP